MRPSNLLCCPSLFLISQRLAFGSCYASHLRISRFLSRAMSTTDDSNSSTTSSLSPLQGGEEEDTLTILGFGSLLSERSSRTTFPNLQHFRLGLLVDFRRVFAHPADIFFQRGIANFETGEMSSLSVEPCPGHSCVVSVFEVPNKDMMEDGIPSRAFLEREAEFDIVTSAFFEIDDLHRDNPKEGIVCKRSTDQAYIQRWGQEHFDERYRKYGIETIWNWSTDSNLRPCAVYLRHCFLAAKGMGEECLTSFLDDTYLVDRKTSVRQYLQDNPQVLETLPPPALGVRYGG